MKNLTEKSSRLKMLVKIHMLLDKWKIDKMQFKLVYSITYFNVLPKQLLACVISVLEGSEDPKVLTALMQAYNKKRYEKSHR